MLDPTWCSYFMDKNGNILDLFELRTLLADGEEVCQNQEFCRNGNSYIKRTRSRFLSAEVADVAPAE